MSRIETTTPTENNFATARSGWNRPEEHVGDFTQILAIFDRELTEEEIWEASGAIGYALRVEINGERLSLPGHWPGKPGRTVVAYNYDTTLAASPDWDILRAFRLAAEYISEGSPVRKTDVAGPGTAGTRLCEGIGEVRVAFRVR